MDTGLKYYLYYICIDAPLYGDHADIWLIRERVCIQAETAEFSRRYTDGAFYVDDRELHALICQPSGSRCPLDTYGRYYQAARYMI